MAAGATVGLCGRSWSYIRGRVHIIVTVDFCVRIMYASSRVVSLIVTCYSTGV